MTDGGRHQGPLLTGKHLSQFDTCATVFGKVRAELDVEMEGAEDCTAPLFSVVSWPGSLSRDNSVSLPRSPRDRKALL